MTRRADALFIKQSSLSLRLVLLILLSLALMLLDSQYNYGQRLRQVILFAASPLQTVVDFPSRTYQWLSYSVSNQKALVDENTKLRYQQSELQSKLQRMVELKRENTKLRELLHYNELNEDNRLLMSEVLAVNTSPYRQQLILDKGTQDGVHPGLAVLDSHGVMGQVIEAGPFTSTLLLVTDSKSAVPVKNSRTGDRGIVVGRQDSMALLHVSKTTSVEVGDKLITSGLGQRFPEGYPVGEVTSVFRSDEETFVKVLVKPHALVNRSRLMLVVKPQKKAQALSQELKKRYQLGDAS